MESQFKHWDKRYLGHLILSGNATSFFYCLSFLKKLYHPWQGFSTFWDQCTLGTWTWSSVPLAARCRAGGEGWHTAGRAARGMGCVAGHGEEGEGGAWLNAEQEQARWGARPDTEWSEVWCMAECRMAAAAA